MAQASAATQQFAKQFGAADGLPQPFIYALSQDTCGYLWIGTAEGLVRYDGTEFRTYTIKDGLVENFVTGLGYDQKTNRLAVRHYQGGRSLQAGARFVRANPADNAGNPALSTNVLDTYQRQYQGQLPPNTKVACSLIDKEGNLWVGTAGQGLWRFADRHITFYPQQPGLGWSTLGGEGSVVAGTISGRLLQPEGVRFGKRTDSFTPLSVPITAICEAGEYLASPDSLETWVGTAGQGVWYRHRGRQMRVAGLPSTLRVTALARAPNGTLWVGTESDGVYQRPADPTQPTQHYTTANGLLQNTIYALLCDSAGRVWVATHGTGLAVWQNNHFQHYRLVAGGLDATALTTDRAGRVWIGTEGDGIFCYEKGRFRQFTTTDGLPSDYCYALAPFQNIGGRHPMYSGYEQGQEYILVVHRNQLSALLTTTGRIVPLSSPNNPWVVDCQPQAGVQYGGNSLWIRTHTGLLRVEVNTRRWQPKLVQPTVFILKAEVDGAEQSANSLGQLSATEHRLAFQFRGISLAQAGALQYQYRLRGYDTLWSQPTTANEARFSRLGAGAYSFEVRARLGEQGVWSAPTVTTFTIATPFYQTWWFAALSVLAAGAGVFTFTRAREATLRRQKLQLETTVRERTQQLRHQKAHIEDMNAELTVARDVAEASRKAKAQFLANMSHEIRTPMNAVIGLTHLLRQTPVSAVQNEYLEAVQSSSQNLLVIINDILDSSKIEAGKLSLEQAAFRLPELLRRVASMFQFATEAKHLYFTLNIDAAVPAAVLGDSVRLNQVLVNLVGNAVKFTTTGGVTLSVTAHELPTGQQVVRFVVQDTGIGIPASKLEAIFEDFSQANTSTTRQFGGTGLGLSIARNLVELHGGRLWVESQEGEGSSFSFEIPYIPADPVDVAPEATLAVGRFEPELRVLVAEDNELNQLVARRTLEAWNVHVTIAANGRLAVEAAERANFDAVLMDVQMPEMDGYEAARQLRALFPDTHQLPIIGLTASALPEDRALALEAGMNDTLAKPFDPALLYARLAHYTNRQPLPTTANPCLLPPESLPDSASHAAADWTLLEELAGGNENFIQQIINTFLAQGPPLQQQLNAAAEASDHSALARAAHKLKGQAAYFGVESLQESLEQLEQQAQQQAPLAVLTGQITEIQEHLALLYPALQIRLARG